MHVPHARSCPVVVVHVTGICLNLTSYPCAECSGLDSTAISQTPCRQVACGQKLRGYDGTGAEAVAPSQPVGLDTSNPFLAEPGAQASGVRVARNSCSISVGNLREALRPDQPFLQVAAGGLAVFTTHFRCAAPALVDTAELGICTSTFALSIFLSTPVPLDPVTTTGESRLPRRSHTGLISVLCALQTGSPSAWQGMRTASAAREPKAEPESALYGPEGPKSWYGVPQIVSWSPRVAIYDNFLTDEECDHLLGLAEPLFEPAMLVSASQGGIHVRSPKRTSYGAFFDRGEDSVLVNIDARIAHVTRYPAGALPPPPLCALRHCSALPAPRPFAALLIRSALSLSIFQAKLPLKSTPASRMGSATTPNTLLQSRAARHRSEPLLWGTLDRPSRCILHRDVHTQAPIAQSPADQLQPRRIDRCSQQARTCRERGTLAGDAVHARGTVHRARGLLQQ